MRSAIRLVVRPARCLLVAALTLGALGSTALGGGLEPWDQQRVTQLARELATATRDVRQAFRQQPAQSIGTQRRRHKEYLDTLRALETATGQLATRLEAGATREETLPIATKLRSQLKRAETLARSVMPTAQMEAAYAPAEHLLRQLAPYYFPPEPAAD